MKLKEGRIGTPKESSFKAVFLKPVYQPPIDFGWLIFFVTIFLELSQNGITFAMS